MIEKYLFATWNAITPGLGNHLWQSTLVVVSAGLLTLVLRKHHARARYWLWLAASLKFLVPFSLLVSIGRRLAWSPPSLSTAKPALYFAVEEISQPFSHAVPAIHAAAPAIPQSSPHLVPFLVALWFCGFLAVLFLWAVRWRRISAAMKASIVLSEGREVGALRRAERLGRVRKPISFLLSPASLEPGIFGIARPVLIWPEGISYCLEDAHLEAILAHEVWHVRRRDNLSATLHMIVEAIFWFYPLVWWVGARLVDERERACDEEVVELGSDRQVYAESILKVCEFCLGSPLPCVAGVTGADLKKRMVHIMTGRVLHKLNFARKLLLTITAALAIAIPITFGALNATPSHAQDQGASAALASTFESVSIKPDRSTTEGTFRTKVMFALNDGSFSARGVTLQRLIQMAYRIQDSQLSGGPDWLSTQKFDIDAKLKQAVADAILKQTKTQKNLDDQVALKALLSQYFKLAVHAETRNLPMYDLVVAENGPKLQESKEPRMVHLEPGQLTSSGIPIRLLADELSHRLGQTVVDKTGLKGSYAFTLHWTPDAGEQARVKAEGSPDAAAPATAEPAGPLLAAALEEQLGLKLEPHTDRVPVLVVDHAEEPAEN